MTIKEYKKICKTAFDQLSRKDREEILWQNFEPILKTYKEIKKQEDE